MGENPDHVIFGNTVGGLFNGALSGKLSPDAHAQLKAVGLDLSRPLHSAYPLRTWEQALVIAGRDLYPYLDEAEQFRQLGRELITGIRTTMLGKAVEQVLKLLGPRRTLKRMNQNLRTSDNFVESRLNELSPNEVEIWISHTMGRPTYYQGIFEEMLEVIEAKSPKVRVHFARGVECTFRIRWE